jgi:4-hydroxy-3-methylbut-2-enyl diphosphate reductase
MPIQLANPRGFCAGVDRAIAIVEKVLEHFGAPIYVRHEVVHNRYVVDDLRQRGAIFVEDLDQIPEQAICIFSAHGVSLAVQRAANARGLRLFDATCPLVTKVHLEVARHSRNGIQTILIGHAGHPEVEGTMGQCQTPHCIQLIESSTDIDHLQIQDPQKLAYVTQTTLSIEDSQDIVSALKQRFPTIRGPKKSDICYATQNRQDAVRRLAKDTELILVVGSVTSSNSNRLKELALKQGTPAYLIDGPEDIATSWLSDKKTIGVTAGASAPELLVERVIDHLQTLGITDIVEQAGIREQVEFALPAELAAL